MIYWYSKWVAINHTYTYITNTTCAQRFKVDLMNSQF